MSEPLKKTLHVTQTTLEDLQFLKRQMGLKNLSDVTDCLIQLYLKIDSFPRSYVEFVDYTRNNSGNSDQAVEKRRSRLVKK